jgi:hypothetical protein
MSCEHKNHCRYFQSRDQLQTLACMSVHAPNLHQSHHAKAQLGERFNLPYFFHKNRCTPAEYNYDTSGEGVVFGRQTSSMRTSSVVLRKGHINWLQRYLVCHVDNIGPIHSDVHGGLK